MMVFEKRSVGTLLTCGLLLASCETTDPQVSLSNIKPPLASLKAKKEISPAVAHAFVLLKEEKYSEASKFINLALQAQPKSVIFHLLNGLTYEKLAEKGEATGTELAAIGYQNAINLDPSNSFAIIQLGKLKYREQLYDQAQEHFANALLLKPNDPELLHEFAAASYYAYDLKSAVFAIDKAEKLKPEDALIHRSAAMIHAALGDFDIAKKHLTIFKEKVGNDPAVEQVSARFNDWQSLYKSGRITLAAATTHSGTPTSQTSTSSSKSGGGKTSADDSTSKGSGAEGGGGGDAGEDSMGKSGPDGAPIPPSEVNEAYNVLNAPIVPPAVEVPDTPEPEIHSAYGPQIIIDCYLLRITEDAETSKGNNILENLAVTLSPGGFTQLSSRFRGTGLLSPGSGGASSSSSVTHSPATGFRSNQLPAVIDGNNASAASSFTPSTQTFNAFNTGSISGRVFAAGITWAGLTYSLNIANAIDTRSEVVSRPSLMTFLKKPSIFFSGRELVLGLAGQYGGTLVRYPVGVTLEVTPQTFDGEYVTLNIGLEGSLLTDPNPALQETVDVGKTRVETFVKVRLGETLMLGGIYERLEVGIKNGVPGLQDVPVVQYFFANESTRSSRRSIVYMLTPRSPDVVKSAVNRAMTREAVRPHVEELVSRNPDWFNTQPNLTKIFRYLNRDPIIYYEFRSSDVLPPSWGWELPLSEKLDQLNAFLYF